MDGKLETISMSCGEHSSQCDLLHILSRFAVSSHASDHKLKYTIRKQLNSQSKVLINGAFMTSCQSTAKIQTIQQTD